MCVSVIAGLDADRDRRARAAVHARGVGRRDARLGEERPGAAAAGQHRAELGEGARAERLGEHRHRDARLRSGDRAGEPHVVARDDAEAGLRQRHGRHRDERAVGARARAGAVRGDEAEVVGRVRREARERLADRDRALAGAGVAVRRLRAVSGRGAVVEVPRRRAAVRVDRARERGGLRDRVLRLAGRDRWAGPR